MKNALDSLSLCFKKSFSEAKSDKSRGKARSSGKQSSAFHEELCRRFSLEEIKAAINNFRRNWLASGSFGDSYRGLIDDGTAVVIERFEPSGLQLQVQVQGVREFQTEVNLLCQLDHPNLVSFIGFCDEKDEKFLVYEYVRNGSLDKYLYGDCSNHPLSWMQRLEICIGAARGLHYLHSGAKHPVIHCTFSTRKILLDDKWTPKLSNLNLSKMSDVDCLNMKIRGTIVSMDPYCYMDPECFVTGQMNRKTDVYAFGVVLFEVLCGRKVIDQTLDLAEGIYDLVSCARKCTENGTIYHIIDPYLKKKIAPECFKKFVELAYYCVCVKGNGRPEMGKVQMALEVALELQKKADFEMESANPRDEYVYEEVLSCQFVRKDFPDNSGNVIEPDSFSNVDSKR